MFKKILMPVLILIFLMNTAGAAGLIEYSGGVADEYEYQEIVFITGQPIEFIGKATVSESVKTGSSTKTIKIAATSKDKSLNGKLDRTLTLNTKINNRTDKGQTIYETTVGKSSETIQLGGDKYTLDDIQLSSSHVSDNRAAADFTSGDIKIKKRFSINKDQGMVIIEGVGSILGYNNFWGATETNIIDYVINYDREYTITTNDEEQTNDVSWIGNYSIKSSFTNQKDLVYSENEANFSSFHGGYSRVVHDEMVTEYSYNLPEMTEQSITETTAIIVPNLSKREIETIKFSKESFPTTERLIVPKFKDMGGHWADDYIQTLYSLDILTEQSEFFTPELNMKRKDFVKAVTLACNLIKEEKTKPKDLKSAFTDVSVDNEYFKYINTAYEQGIIKGISESRFNPEESLTRAEAITFLVRALGFETKAPTPGYYTKFADDYLIPIWAKDSIYVASEFGLVSGDDYEYINPDKLMTKAEAAAMLCNFLEFLRDDLQKDYRDNMFYFG